VNQYSILKDLDQGVEISSNRLHGKKKLKDQKMVLKGFTDSDWVEKGLPICSETRQYFMSEPTISYEEAGKVLTCADRMYEVLHVYGLNRPKSILSRKDYFGVNKTYERSYWKRRSKFTIDLLEYVEKNGPGSWVSILKFKVTAFFSFYHLQDLPVPPGVETRHKEDTNLFLNSILIGGHVDRWFKDLLNHESKRSIMWSLLHSILHYKKGSPVVPKSMVKAAVYKTVLQLTSDPKPSVEFQIEDEELADFRVFGRTEFKPNGYDWEETSGMPQDHVLDINKDIIRVQLQRTVRETFKGKKTNLQRYCSTILPLHKSKRGVFKGVWWPSRRFGKISETIQEE
jgi:hypothetical protein